MNRPKTLYSGHPDTTRLFHPDNFPDYMEKFPGAKEIVNQESDDLTASKGRQIVYHIEPQGVTLHFSYSENRDEDVGGDDLYLVGVDLYGSRNRRKSIDEKILSDARRFRLNNSVLVRK